MENITFQKALEVIESLPEEQRESLIDIVKRRLIEERRDRLAQRIAEAREEYKRGETKKGTVDDLMGELPK
jgi:U3 small nucleolar ribonucleoprotein component